jgi:hypothetical protein
MSESLVTLVSPLWQNKLYRITSSLVLCNAAAHVIQLATLVEQVHSPGKWYDEEGKFVGRKDDAHQLLHT